MVEALPGLAEVTAAVERALVAHRGDTEGGVHRARIVLRHLDVARVGQRREAADAHLLPMRTAVAAAEETHAVRQEHRAGLGRAGGERMGIHHSLGLGVADDAAPEARFLGEFQEALVAALPAVTAITAAHHAADFEPGIDLTRMARVEREADDAAGKAHPHHALGRRRGQLFPAPSAIAAAIDRGALRADIDRPRIAGVEQDRPHQPLLAGQLQPAPALAGIGAAIGTPLRADIDHFAGAGLRRDAACLDAVGETGGQLLPPSGVGIQAVKAAGARILARRDPGRGPGIDVAQHFRPLGCSLRITLLQASWAVSEWIATIGRNSRSYGRTHWRRN